MMERNSFISPLKVPKGGLKDPSKVLGPPLAQQRGHLQEAHPAKAYKAHTNIQTPVCKRVSRREFEESVMILCRSTDAQNASLHPNWRVEPRQRAVTEQSGPPLHPQQPRDSNNLVQEAILPGVLSSGNSQKPYGLSYVEKQREAQKFHSKVQPSYISNLIQPHAPHDREKPWKAVLRGRFAPRRQCKVPSDEMPPIHLQNQQIMRKAPNWPFGVTTTSRRGASRRVSHSPLTTREIQLLLRNPHIRDGNICYLRTPEGLTRTLPSPHVYGSTPGAEPTSKISRLPARPPAGLKRRNAQRKQPQLLAPQGFESFHNPCHAKFRRGPVARDVNLIYSSPVDRARRKSILPQIQEAGDDSAGDESTHSPSSQDEYASRVQTDWEPVLEQPQHREENDESLWPLGSTTKRRVSLSTPKNEDDSSKQNDIGIRTDKTLQRLSFVIRGPRPGPTSVAMPSPTSSTPPSTAQTAAPHKSTLTPEPQLNPEPGSESEHLTEDGPCCNVAGCTWPGCSRLRGVLKMPIQSNPVQNTGSAAEGRDGDFQSVGDGFAFVKLH